MVVKLWLINNMGWLEAPNLAIVAPFNIRLRENVICNIKFVNSKYLSLLTECIVVYLSVSLLNECIVVGRVACNQTDY